MDFDTAMDPLTEVTLAEAKQELMKHGFPSYIEGGYIYAEIEVVMLDGSVQTEETMVCQVQDGEVYSSELLQWLGY